MPRTVVALASQALLAVLCLALPAPAAGQLTNPPSDTLPAQPAETPVSPRGAFLRALAVPGWGHVAIGAPGRGAFYFVSESAAAWMMVRTRTRLNAAKRVRDFRVVEAIGRLTAVGVTNPEEVARALEADTTLVAAGSLVEARSQQFEDWLVFGVFLAFFSGADAFVSAHLRNFPNPVGVDVTPFPAGVQLQLRLPLGGPSRATRTRR